MIYKCRKSPDDEHTWKIVTKDKTECIYCKDTFTYKILPQEYNVIGFDVVDKTIPSVSGQAGWERQTLPVKGKSYGWIQWKGTQVCLDIHCICGLSGHIDRDFVYYIECKCGRFYMTNGHIELVELTKEEIELNKGRKTAIVKAEDIDWNV